MQYSDVKAGTHDGKAVSWGYFRATTGSEGLLVDCEVRVKTGPRPAPDAPEPYETVVMQKVLYFSEGAMESTMRALAALGAWEKGADDAARVAALDALVRGEGALPNEVDLVIDIENSTYEDPKTGETKKRSGPRIQFINEKGGGGLRKTDASPGELQGVVNRFASLLAKQGAKAAAAATTGRAPRPAIANGAPPGAPPSPKPAADDDIPF